MTWEDDFLDAALSGASTFTATAANPPMHLDFKRGPEGWLVWCKAHGGWARLVLGECSGCGADVSHRFKPGVLA